MMRISPGDSPGGMKTDRHSRNLSLMLTLNLSTAYNHALLMKMPTLSLKPECREQASKAKQQNLPSVCSALKTSRPELLDIKSSFFPQSILWGGLGYSGCLRKQRATVSSLERTPIAIPHSQGISRTHRETIQRERSA